MANSTKIIKIDDVEYTVTQIGGVEGLDLFDRLTAALGSSLMEAVRQGIMGGKLTEDLLGAAVARAYVTMPSDLKSDLRVKFARLTTIKAGGLQLPLCSENGTLQVGDTFDQHFAGRFPHMAKWLIAAMQWGFASFLPKSGDSDAKTQTTTTASP
jgi:hypothetical protein